MPSATENFGRMPSRSTLASTGRVSVRSMVRPLVSISRIKIVASSGLVEGIGSGSVTCAVALPCSSVVPTMPSGWRSALIVSSSRPKL